MKVLAIACLVASLAGCSARGARVSDSGNGGEDNRDANGVPDAPGEATPNLFASASGTVDVFVNGASVGSSTAAGALLAASRSLIAGENIIVLRARSGTAMQPYALAQVGGAFGKAGTSARWKAKAAVGTEATDPSGPWATLGYDDASWALAKDVQVAPTAPFPTDGPARGIWTANATDATILLRLVLYVPAGMSAETPYGFARGVTGGQGGSIVTVTTPGELAAAVVGTAPKIVRVVGTIDFTGTEGPITSTVCLQSQCTPPTQNEYIVQTLGACTGVPTFSFTYDKAGTTQLAVGSNTTIIGVGPDATIKGKGLRMANGASNIIVQNVTITSINPQLVWGGDAIHIDNASNIWIDHVRVSLIGRQMIVTGFGAASNVTLSWNEFDGRTPYASFCNGAHFWLMLFLGSADTITVSNNWIHDTSGRGPHAGGLQNATSTVQLVNDYYEHVPGFAAQPITIYARLLFEGTYMSDVTEPFRIDTTTAPAPGHAFAPLASTVSGTDAACHAALGRSCVANVEAPTNATFPLDQAVLDAFSSADPAAVVTPYPASEVPHVVPHLAGPGHI